MTNIKIPDALADAFANGLTVTVPVDDAIEYYDIIVEHLGGMDYRCTAKTNVGDRFVDYPKYEDKPEDQSIGDWIANMQRGEIMAGFRVYYDIWNFEDANELYKELFETFEREQKNRDALSRPEIGTLRFRSDTNTTEVFTGTEWEHLMGNSL